MALDIDPNKAGRGAKIDQAKRSAGPNGLIDESQFQSPSGMGVDPRARALNASTADRNYQSSLVGGRWSADAAERGQQQRDFHQTDDFKKYWNALDPATQLKEQAGTEAYKFRQNLGGMQNEAQDDIKSQAGQALDEGIRSTRQGANSRGLLYSGLRQGAEQGVRGRVANAMAGQISQSNRGLANEADAKDRAVASMGLASAQQAQDAASRASEMSAQNAIGRAQQMQQLSGLIGYGFGQAMGGRGDATSNYDKYGGGSYGGGR